MNKKESIEKIFHYLMENGTVSERGDIFAFDPMNKKVYTKKLKIGKNIGEIEIVYVTITSDDKNFSDVSINNMRINTKNVYDTWLNLFANEADDLILNKILEKIL